MNNQIDLIDFNKIQPYNYNNKLHTDSHVAAIAESIKQFGFNQPIVVDENYVILVGHGRYFAARKLELAEVPVIKLTDLTNDQKKAYRLIDNKLSAQPIWNFENIQIELAELAGNNFDYAPWALNELIPTTPDVDVQDLEINEPVIFDDSFMIRINCTTIEEKRNIQSIFGLSTKERTIAYDNFIKIWNNNED